MKGKVSFTIKKAQDRFYTQVTEHTQYFSLSLLNNCGVCQKGSMFRGTNVKKKEEVFDSTLVVDF